MQKLKYSLFLVSLGILLFTMTIALFGNMDGRTGRTLKTSTSGCGGCHGSSATTGVSVLINGPDTIIAGQTAEFSLAISQSGKTGVGLDIATRNGTLAPVSSNIRIANGELTQNNNISMTSGSVTVQFNYTAPGSIGTDTLWATGLATNSNGGTSGDDWNWATSKRIIVISPKPILIYPPDNSLNNPLTINFRWNKFKTAEFYILNIAADYNFSNIVVNDTIYNDTSKIISGFQKGVKYYWRLRAGDSSGTVFNSLISNFTTIYPIQTNIKLLFEGMYSTFYNQLIRKDSITVYLRNASPPFSLLDSAKSSLDTISFTGLSKFLNEVTGTYYLVINHLNSIETWSKTGGIFLTNNGTIYNYDFTTSLAQAYGNNLKLKGSKYCLYSGDVNKDGYINLSDVIPINNDASNFVTGIYLVNDLTGDNIVDLTDVSLCYNNASNFVGVIRP